MIDTQRLINEIKQLTEERDRLVLLLNEAKDALDKFSTMQPRVFADSGRILAGIESIVIDQALNPPKSDECCNNIPCGCG